MKIRVDYNLCDGNGMCAFEAPEYFEMGDDDELILLNQEVMPADVARVRAAAQICPKRAILLESE